MPDQSSLVKRVFTPLLVLGHPGAGKTSLFATFAEYLWETDKRVLLLYSWDGGAIPTTVQRLMKYGLIRFWRVRTRSMPGLAVESVYDAARGCWPRTINPETGETDPAVPLVAPIEQRYVLRCAKTGETLATQPMPQVGLVYCTACKVHHDKDGVLVKGEIAPTPGYEQVGGVGFDSLTAMGYIILDHMDHARGAGQVGGEKSSFGGPVISGDTKFGGTNRADIGFAQTRCREAVHNSSAIPNLIESPVFTALSFEAADEGGLPIVGPKLPGRAATDEASAWFGNVTEMGRVVDAAGKEHYALYLRPFTDAQNRRHLLKTSGSPGVVPDVLVDPIGQPWAEANLGKYFKMLDADLTGAMAQDIPDAPGLAATPTTYGTPFKVTAQPAPQAPAGGNGQGQLAPLVQPPTPSPQPAAAAPSAPPAGIVSRRRPVKAEPPTTPPTPTTATPSTTPPDEPPPVAAAASEAPGGPPPPPGMKPPQRAPGT